MTGERLGLTVPLEGADLTRHGALAAEWEALGYTDVWSSEGNGADAFSPLLAAALAAPRLHVGTAIVPVSTRGPVVLAQSAASLAALAPGGFTLGLGAASELVAEAWNGAPFVRPYSRVRDTVQFLRDAFAGERVDRDYGTFAVRRFRLGLVPERPPAILLAALGERMLRLAGALADGAILTWLTPADVAALVPLVRAGGPSKQVVARVWVAPTTDAAAARDAVRPVAAAFLCGPALRRTHERRGRGGLLAETWRRWEARDHRGAAAAIPDALLDELVVHGPPAAVHEHVAAYRASGVDVPVLALLPVPGVNPVEAARTLAPS